MLKRNITNLRSNTITVYYMVHLWFKSITGKLPRHVCVWLVNCVSDTETHLPVVWLMKLLPQRIWTPENIQSMHWNKTNLKYRTYWQKNVLKLENHLWVLKIQNRVERSNKYFLVLVHLSIYLTVLIEYPFCCKSIKKLGTQFNKTFCEALSVAL